MKIIILSALFAMAFSTSDYSNDTEKISQVIQSFAKAGDSQNSEKLSELTSDQFRVLMNQLFGSDEISVLQKKDYLTMIQQKKFGGDDREVEIELISISGKNAVAKINFWGKKMNVNSLITLSKNASGKWLITSDTPSIL